MFFVFYHRKTGQKKKLNTFIEFPELIDLSTYLDEEGIDHLTHIGITKEGLQ